MNEEACPVCGASIPEPSGIHGPLNRGRMHSNRYCPECNRPLVWFSEGPLAGAWRIDDGISHLDRSTPSRLRPAA